MLKMIFLLARRMFIRLLLVLLPLGLFMFLAQAIPLSPLQSLLVLVPVIAFEVWLVIRHLLPVMGELVTKTLYSSNITTDEEVLVEASRRMLNSGIPRALWNCWNATGRRIRGWCVPGSWNPAC